MPSAIRRASSRLPYLEFFAGSGLVAEGLASAFRPAWANDLCPRKAKTYTANHGDQHFRLGSIADVKGAELPAAAMAWASFPCQDLSLAGKQTGIHGARSGLVWEWLRALDEMPSPPPVLVAENVVGLVSAKDGAGYRVLHDALRARGYRAGALLLDAARWLPQSRPRVFVVAVREGVALPESLIADGPGWAHSAAIQRVQEGLDGWVWWALPEPPARSSSLADVLDWTVPWGAAGAEQRTRELVHPDHETALRARAGNGRAVAAGYRRTREHEQVVELRFDGIAGCLRTPKGGSSRQLVVCAEKSGAGPLRSRWLTPREAARLMGAPDSYALVGSDTAAYGAMGDAVAVPVARWLGTHLLAPLAMAATANALAPV